MRKVLNLFRQNNQLILKTFSMETLVMNRTAIIEEALEKSISYNEYRTLVSQLSEQDANTGPEQTEALANYTKLNDRRMKRLDKTVKINEQISEKAKKYDRKVNWLVLTESWCGDAAQTMPVINKIAELNDNIDFKVVLRDENLVLMDQFLTNGGRSIPKLIAIDDATKQVIGEFGPRPSVATKMVQDYKEAHGQLTPEFKQDLQVWYNKDKGLNTAEDIVALLG